MIEVMYPRRRGLRLSTQWLIFIISIGLSFLSRNPVPFLVGMMVFLFFLKKFYDREIPPIMLYSFVFQWLFFQTQLFDALARGEDLIYLDFVSHTKPDITILGLIAVFFFFFGMYLVIRKIPFSTYQDFVSFLNRVNLERILVIYGIVYVALFFLGRFIWVFPSMTQPLFVLLEFRWALFFLMFSASFAQNRLKGVVLCFVLLEIFVSFFSFFSHFKEAIIFSFISYWIFFFRSSMVSRILAIPIILAIFYLGTLWSSIKEDYRDFLNKGTGAQTILVSRSEAYDKLVNLVLVVDDKKLEKGFEELVDRLSWIGAFDAVYNYVPRLRPHEDGALWMEGIKRTFMPRLFFPEKKALTDSKELNYYSGLKVDEKDTSISLSVIAASYVDFGAFWMHAPLFLLGLFCGWTYRKAFQWGIYPPVGFALTMPLIYIVQISDNSINKLLPHIFLYFLVLWAIHRFLLKSFLGYIIK